MYWQARYVRGLVCSDTVIICVALFVAELLRFGVLGQPVVWPWTGGPLGYTVGSAVLAGSWIASMALFNTRSKRVLGAGIDEYRRIASATFWLFGLIAMASLTFGIDLGRGYLAMALTLGLAGLTTNRWCWRRIVERQRRDGKCQSSVLVVGSDEAAASLAASLSEGATAGYQVVGLCTPGGEIGSGGVLGTRGMAFPVVGVDRAVVDAVLATGADTVAIAPTEDLGPVELRRLMWDLDGLGVDLIVTPGLIDVAGHRIGTRLVEGMAMLDIEEPLYSRANSWGKRLFDVVFASTALLVAALPLLVAAVAVRATSPGPVFYRSQRIGMNGVPFDMIKFRSMYVDAEDKLAALMAEHGGDQLFFKVKNDPRVTSAGRILRKFSIDELPQFLNVLRGEMSVVGPRPQVRREVDAYDDMVRRRLSVRPGVTGLWQVSGRSDLAVEAAIRLDLSYVENWSMYQDLLIIAKTLPAVVRGTGAY